MLIFLSASNLLLLFSECNFVNLKKKKKLFFKKMQLNFLKERQMNIYI